MEGRAFVFPFGILAGGLERAEVTVLPFNKRSQRGGGGDGSEQTLIAKEQPPAKKEVAAKAAPAPAPAPKKEIPREQASARNLPARPRMFERSLSEEELTNLLPQKSPTIPPGRASSPMASPAPAAGRPARPLLEDDEEHATQIFDSQTLAGGTKRRGNAPPVKATLLKGPPLIAADDSGERMTITNEDDDEPQERTMMLETGSAQFPAQPKMMTFDDILPREEVPQARPSAPQSSLGRPRSVAPPAFARTADIQQHTVPHAFAPVQRPPTAPPSNVNMNANLSGGYPMAMSGGHPMHNAHNSGAMMAVAVPMSDARLESTGAAALPARTKSRGFGPWAAAFAAVAVVAGAAAFVTMRSPGSAQATASFVDPAPHAAKPAEPTAPAASTAAVAVAAPTDAPAPITPPTPATPPTAVNVDPAMSAALAPPPATTATATATAAAAPATTADPASSAVAAASAKPASTQRPVAMYVPPPQPKVNTIPDAPKEPKPAPVAQAPKDPPTPKEPKEPKGGKKPAGVSDEDKKAADEAKALADKQLQQSL